MALRTVIAAGAALALLGLLSPAQAAEDPLKGDLRELRVGMTVDELPEQGYVNLACGTDGSAPGTPIASWHDYAGCPSEASGWHEVAFEFEESPWAEAGDRWEGTKVAGHPVIPSLLIDDQGVVQGIRIVTDPDTRLYLKKKAFLMYIRVMGRYGQEGWQCVEHEPSQGRTPIGGMYIDRQCEKTFHDRKLILNTELFREPEQQGQEFTGGTRLEILKQATG